ncbi:MAG: ArsC family reductase [Gammaproteobacteria bacterium]
MILYGISNCDTIKKAKKWLSDQMVAFQFHDFRKDGLETEQLEIWIDALGWEVLLNKRGTTWRKLDESDQADLDAEKACALMVKHPALIKRPVLVTADEIIVGFKPEEYARLIDQL